MEQLVAKFECSVRVSRRPDDIPVSSPTESTPREVPISDMVESVPSSLKTQTAKETCDSRLESLPPEIRRHLLSTLDLERLKSLVRASPTFHEQYLLDRKYLLCRSLERTLGSVTVDAYAVHQCTAQDGGNINRTYVTGFINWYSEQISRRSLVLPNTLSLDEALDMAFFYLDHVKPITEHYSRWALDDLVEKAGDEAHDHTKPLELTSAESMRFRRVIYRFQLLCHLVGHLTRGFTRIREDVALELIGGLEPWEVEELVSFHEWALGVYDKRFDDIILDLCPDDDDPSFDDQNRPPTPPWAYEEYNIGNDSYVRNVFLEGIALHGIPLLRTVLFGIRNHEHLVSTIREHMTMSYILMSQLGGVFSQRQQAMRRRIHPSDRHRMQEERAPFPFRGDGEPDAPPLAWTTLWGDTYSNMYGLYIPGDLRRWGYVFWDAARLEALGGKELLKRQWEMYWVGHWGEYDPSNDVF